MGIIQALARQEACHRTAGVGAAGQSLRVIVPTPIEFALQHEVDRLRQLPSDAAQVGNMATPVMSQKAIAAAEQLHQAPFAVHQRRCDAIHLRLYPDIALALQPSYHCLFIGQFDHAGVRYRVR